MGYAAVTCSSCTREECRVISKTTGASYQKCHVYVKEVVGDHLLIHYVKNEQEDEWISCYDPRLIIDKDENWCAHGKVCNRMKRRHKCTVANCSAQFCHDPKCLMRKSCTRPTANTGP